MQMTMSVGVEENGINEYGKLIKKLNRNLFVIVNGFLKKDMFNINECSCDYIVKESSGEKLDSHLPCPEDKGGSFEAGRLIIILTHVTNHRTRTMYMGGSTKLTQDLVDAGRAEQSDGVGLASP